MDARGAAPGQAPAEDLVVEPLLQLGGQRPFALQNGSGSLRVETPAALGVALVLPRSRGGYPPHDVARRLAPREPVVALVRRGGFDVAGDVDPVGDRPGDLGAVVLARRLEA